MGRLIATFVVLLGFGCRIALADQLAPQQDQAPHPWRVLDPKLGPILRPGWELSGDHKVSGEQKNAMDMHPTPVGTVPMSRFRIHGWAERMRFSTTAQLLHVRSETSPCWSFQSSVWRVEDGAYQPAAYGAAAAAITFSPNGTLAVVDQEAAEANGKGISIVLAKTAEPLCTLVDSSGLVRVGKKPRRIYISANNAVVAAASLGKVMTWNVTTGQRLSIVDSAQETFRLSRDGTKLAVFDKLQHVRLHDVPTGKLVSEFDGEGTRDWEFSPDGQTIALRKTDIAKRFAGTWLDIRTTKSGEPVTAITHRSIDGFAYHPDSQSILTVEGLYDPGGEGKLGWHNVKTGQMINRRPAGTPVAYCIAMSDTKPILAFNTSDGCEVWDLDRGARLMATRLSSPAVNLALDWENSVLAVSDREERLHVFQVRDAVESARPEGHHRAVTSFAFSEDGRRIATAGVDRTVRLWEAPSCKEIAIFDDKEYVQGVSRTSNADIWLLLTADAIVRWNSRTGETSRTKIRSIAPYQLGQFSRDSLFVSILDYGIHNSFDVGGTLQIIATKTGALMQTISGVYARAFSPDSSTIAAALRNEVVLINLTTRTAARAPLTGNTPITAVAFSPDGQLLAVADRKQIRFLGTRDLKPTAALPADGMGVGALSFTPDGKTLVVAGVDAVSSWEVATKRELSRQTTPRRASWDVKGWSDERKIEPFSLYSDDRENFLKGYSVTVLNQIALEISPDGTFAVTNSSDLAPLYWPIPGVPQNTTRNE